MRTKGSPEFQKEPQVPGSYQMADYALGLPRMSMEFDRDFERETHGHHPSDWQHGWQGNYPTLHYIGTSEGWYMAPPCESDWEGVYEVKVVYIIHAKETRRVKIGTSKNPQGRLRDLQVGSPERLELVHVLPDASEQEMHLRFQRFHTHGEWFSDEILEEIEGNP